jgi:hypothetical protein
MSSEPDKSCATWFVVNLGLAVRHFSKCCKSSLIIGCYRLAHVIHSNISYLGPSSTELMLGPIAFHHVCAAFPRSRRLFFTSPRTCSAVLCCVFFSTSPRGQGASTGFITMLHNTAWWCCLPYTVRLPVLLYRWLCTTQLVWRIFCATSSDMLLDLLVICWGLF